MYKLNLFKYIASGIITLLLLGVFAAPATASASFSLGSILASIGINTGSTTTTGSYYYNSYDNNSTTGYHQGNIEVIKQVRDLTRGTGFRSSITVRSGSLVQVAIEVKNNSNVDTNVSVNDQITGSYVYVNNSLLLAGTPIQGSITSGIVINVPKKSNITVYYNINVCSDSGYVARAYAYAAGIGSATDATSIATEQVAYGSSDFTYQCLQSFQQNNSTNTSYSDSYSTGSSSNPFGTWTGVNNSNATYNTNTNPFGTWTGVNNSNSSTSSTSSSSTTNNPFGDWAGVNNANGSVNTSTDPFGTWTGVNNSNQTYNTNTNPFGTWTGVNNSNATYNTNTNPFGNWSGTDSNTNSNSSSPFGSWNGVSSSSSTSSSNPFGDWSGVNSNTSNLAYDASGYTASTSSTSFASTNNSSQNAAIATNDTHYVAPTTGVNETAPFVFGGFLTIGFLAYRKRKLLFN